MPAEAKTLSRFTIHVPVPEPSSVTVDAEESAAEVAMLKKVMVPVGVGPAFTGSTVDVSVTWAAGL